MPIYEYRCDSCGHQLDALQKIADAHLTDCPACGQPALRRMVSAPSFRLKGSGWYETDFKKDQDRKRNLADSSTPAGDAGATVAKSEASAGDGASKTPSSSGDKSGPSEAVA